jgi:uncharacterized protein (TIGR03382 family)
VIGRVTAVNRLPAPTPGAAATGRTRVDAVGPVDEVRVTALAYFIGPDRGRDLRFTVPGSSVFAYPFEPGTTYFIPVRDDQGRDVPGVCDGITALPGAGPALERETTRLITAATAEGVPAVRVRAADTGGPAAAPAPAAVAQTDGRPGTAGISVAVMLAVAAALAVWTRRRRRSSRQQAVPS